MRRQKEWLKQSLEGSTAAWKVLANQVMMMSLDVGTPGVGFNADQWDGYAAERRELCQHLLAKGVKDVSFLTGDIHTFFAGSVTTSGRVGAPRAATEFVAGSITSEGIAEELGGQSVLADRIGNINPHIAYTETSRRGYAIVEAWADELKVTFRSPASVLTPTSPVTDLARFRVARGSTMVERML